MGKLKIMYASVLTILVAALVLSLPINVTVSGGMHDTIPVKMDNVIMTVGHHIVDTPNEQVMVYHSVTDHNLITNVGLQDIAKILSSGSTGGGGQTNLTAFIGVSNSANGVAVTNTTLDGELATNGLTRAVATYAYTASNAYYNLTVTFTYTSASSTVVHKAGIFTAGSAGDLIATTVFGSDATLSSSGDTLYINWQIND